MIEMPLMLAQVDPTGGFYELLLKNGVMGLAVAVLLYFLIKKDGELQKVQEARLEDSKALSEVVKNQTLALQTMNTINEDKNRAIEASIKVAEKSASVLEQLSNDVRELKHKG